MDQYEMAYAQALIDYNTALLSGDPAPNLVDKFAAVMAPFHDSVSWKLLHYQLVPHSIIR